jgi:hypothetical protein
LENFEETLRNIDSFCRVAVKKSEENAQETDGRSSLNLTEQSLFKKNLAVGSSQISSANGKFAVLPNVEEPLIDVFEEEDHVRILVQCRCREQQVTFHPSQDGIRVCREECQLDADGTETCQDVCRKLNLRTDHLQIDNMLFIIAKCNNNNTLEAMIPKIRK